ncbi:intercellular adhesin biosynthesis polysaccharide N-deacetylase [Macrococcus lamae]|uniref:Poly-beta-1,6-N-acetyl-D-glucosamine N-deacetylase n=1 Tax=Macrococcus lamae TaxID=198484 RepID=A0A4R6BU06_9STAP|nr:intercellular adhesin biosynthesis polysaccharide N-deacetylase [Macrococcus lamae]TDM10571.1 intercellular adhesin biosynthesis polysaccharide N-deacetylase [Macrococcus lamae]
MKLKTVLTFILLAGMAFTLGWWINHNIRAHQVKLKYDTLETENSCLALNYHRVREATLYNRVLKTISNNNELRKYSVFEKDFEKQIVWMKEHGATFLTQKEFLQHYNKQQFPKGCVWLSFDDADVTTYKNAMPILKKHDVPATVFVIAGQVGNPSFNNIRIATWSQLRAMKKSGVFDFGSHTYNMHELKNNHSVLNTAKPSEFKADLKHSRKVIKKELGVTVDTFAYPYGDATDKIVKTLEEADFDNAFILAPYAVTKDNSPYLINRIMVDDDAFTHHVKKWGGFTSTKQ